MTTQERPMATLGADLRAGKYGADAAAEYQALRQAITDAGAAVRIADAAQLRAGLALDDFVQRILAGKGNAE